MASQESPASETDQQTPGKASLSLDTIFRLLSNHHRRFALYSLLNSPTGIVAFDDLVINVAQRVAESTGGTKTGDLHNEIASELHHWHLPVLEESNVITYDDRSDVVEFHGESRLITWAERVAHGELE